MIIDDESKINMIRRALSSVEGWQNLAAAIGNDENKKEETIRIFKLIAKDTNITVSKPMSEDSCEFNYKDQPYLEGSIVVPFIDLLVQQLDRYIETTKCNSLIKSEICP